MYSETLKKLVAVPYFEPTKIDGQWYCRNANNIYVFRIRTNHTPCWALCETQYPVRLGTAEPPE